MFFGINDFFVNIQFLCIFIVIIVMVWRGVKEIYIDKLILEYVKNICGL